MAFERDPENERRDCRRPECCEQRVLCRECEPPPALPGGERAGDERIDDEPEAQEERCAAERGHQMVDAMAGCVWGWLRPSRVVVTAEGKAGCLGKAVAAARRRA